MASKDLDSPMATHLGGKKRADKGGDKGGVFDHNPTPVVSHPRDKGAEVASEKFYEDLPGSPGVLDTPFGTQLPNPKNIKSK